MMPAENPPPKIAIFVSFSGQGGVERMMLNLAEGLAGHGCRIDLLLIKSQQTALPILPGRVRVIHLAAGHTYGSLPALKRYLHSERPQALLAAKDRANQVAVIAKCLTTDPPRLTVRMGTTVSAALSGRSWLKKMLWYLPMRLFYRGADEIVAVSAGVKNDMARIAGLQADRITVIANPVVSSKIHELAQAPPPHSWLTQNDPPVIIAAGRLTRQKDFPTLIKAVAMASADRPMRLLILGEGADRRKLAALAEQLDIGQSVAMPGYATNPYAYISRANLFVLSSIWEGSPNVLTEAMALGVPVVATDCPSGPREILQNGRYGSLVAMGDAHGMADAILDALTNPPPAALLQSAVEDYTVDNSSRRYLKVLLGPER